MYCFVCRQLADNNTLLKPVQEGRKSGTFSSLIARQFPHEFVENNIEL